MVILPQLQYSMIKVLVESSGAIDAVKLAGAVGRRVEDIMRDLEELRVKGLIKVEYSTVNRVTLTKEGEKYLASGLPEERLLNELKRLGGRGVLSEVKAHLDLSEEEFTAALGRLRRFNAVKVEGDYLMLTGDEAGLSSYLQGLRSFLGSIGGGVDYEGDLPQIAGEARRRGLIRVSQVKRIMVSATELAISQYRAGELTSARVITSLTSVDLATGSWRGAVFKEFDLSIEVPLRPIKRKHPFIQFLNHVREELVAMGFQEVKDNHVDVALWNFDALLVPQYHPARRETDVFYVDGNVKPSEAPRDVLERAGAMHSGTWAYSWSGEEAMRLLLRTHTTLVTIKHIYRNGAGEYRVFSLDRVYRPDTPDPTHFMEFHQLEGIIVGRGVSFRNLLGFFVELANRLRLGRVYFKPAYFPFTEPSVEGYVKHPKLGQLEVFPGGMFRPEVLNVVGLSTDYRVAAWGVGIDRLAMVALGINDIRELYSNNLRVIESTPVGVV